MSANIVKYAFIAGEISPTLLGRTDLTKYDLALAEARNFFVDYRGGLSSRPGTQFIDKVHLGELHTRMFTFSFAPNVANSYVIMFGHNYIRFYQDGGLVLDGSTPYEVASPFTTDDLDGLTVEQYRDLLRITSKDFPVYNLIRNDHTDWDLEIEEVSPFVAGITITGLNSSDTGNAATIFGVTRVLDDGTESALGPPALMDNIENYTVERGSVSITWAPDSEAKFYNVYRSVVASGSQLTSSGSPLGFLGRSHGAKFTDPNIIPDFTHTPPIFDNPFAPGAIEKITITGGGTGYDDFAAEISITDPTGTGFVGHVIVDDSGAVSAVEIKYGGTGYTDPSISFTTGTGATATATVRPLTGTYPALSKIFQQRQIYACTENEPIDIWGSRIKQFSNFAASDYVLDDDSFNFTLDSSAISPIRHLLVTRGGLLAMTQVDVWLLSGGSGPLTPTNALADPQSFTGVSTLQPLTIDNDILFVEGKGFAVRLLAYNEVSKAYNSEDKSILSSHLFGIGKNIIRWAFQEVPFKIVWAVREDGALLAFTSIKAEDVFAWTPCQTKGKVTDVVVLQEDQNDRVYITVERKIGGQWIKFLERLDLRQYINIEDAWCVDCGLSLPINNPPGKVTFFHVDGVWTAETELAVTYSVGDYIRGANGIFKITAGSGQTLTLEMFAEPTNFIPENGDVETFPVPSGEWSIDTPVDTLSGLDHLEGEEVAILADGNVFPRKTVVAGSITLEHEVTRAIVGLPFTCRAKTLPMIVPNAAIEARRKRVVGIGIRQDKSRGIKIGPTLDRMKPMRERTTEAYGHSTRMVGGMKYQLVPTDWTEEGQTYFVQEEPLPVNILSIVSDIEVGDEQD